MSSGDRIADMDKDPSRFLPPITGYENEPVVSLEEATKPLKDIVPELEHMIHVVMKNCRNPKGGLTREESASIMLYTLEWTPSTSSFFYIFNETMRLKNRKKLIPWFPYLRLFVEALTKLPKEQPRLLYRGIKTDESAKYPDGGECLWWSFSSCTKSLKSVKDFIGNEGPGTIFNVRCRIAIDIHQHSMHDDEEEILLYPGREFRILSSTKLHNVHIVDLEEIEPKYPNFYLPKKSVPPSSINVLLLGPAGVGKATFINGLVNYLKYPRLQQALQSEVRTVIPLSFLYNSSHRGLEMQTIRLGQDDRFDRSRTCQTYTIEVDPTTRTELCLIDTPSFDGDVNPDENLQMILNYMKTLTYINAVCFILKPDETSLGQLPMYFPRIMNSLGPNSHENVIFTFTHIRKSLYTLGHTVSLLRDLFQSLQMNNLNLSRSNAFLFENAAFRYLMLRKQGIDLDAASDELYTTQWRAAATESTRLFQKLQHLPRRTLNR